VKKSLLAVAVLALPAFMSAATIGGLTLTDGGACDTTNYMPFGPGPVTGSVAGTGKIGIGSGCSMGDKLIGNFDLVSGRLPADYRIFFDNPNPNQYVVSVGGQLRTDFSLTYSALVTSPTQQIRILSGSVAANVNPGGPTATIEKFATGYDANGNVTSGSIHLGSTTNLAFVMIPVGTVRLDVTDIFRASVNGASNFNNNIIEPPGGVPEPATMALMGFGLAVVGFTARRRRA